ncbi:PAS domain S-box protein [Mesorhizobium sp. M7D.F.Ca.US.005.01.1.1]|jgi:PAS domain S-box-containing protein|uniref:Blue-light-activated histidine kinase n=1 Tax=Rhizobium loti TaxID=381 RepID=A0A8E2W7H9_RHILI|nr:MULTISPECIES: sensor histidine kinase [Mesorhizobium]AZO41498.1 PAS domain S-box protein [Mesorhizobium sp. M7D.F.Ca.US.005.01.1.1]PWJ87923.1 PAS domain S-box-containing protein [Mesorhizobium loti]
MRSYLRGLKSWVSGPPLTHVASLSVLAVSIIFETTNSILVGQDGAFVALIPAILVIVYLEGRVAAIAATLFMAAAGLGARRALNAQLSAEDWTRAIFLLVSGGLIAFMFHRLRQDLRGALEVAETRLAAIDATETRYRGAFERAAMGFVNTNRRGEMLLSNSRLRDMTGYGEKELAQLNLEELIHPDDRDSVLGPLRTLDRTASFAADVRLLRQDRTTFWARLALSSSQPDEVSSESVFVVVDDISERRMAREALRAQKEWLDLALSAGRLGTWRVDLEDGTVTGSGKFWDIFGLPPAPIRRLEELSTVVHPADWPKLAASAIPSSAVNYDIEIRVRRSDGHVRWIALRGRQEKHGDGSWRIGVAADLTERRQATLLRIAVKKRELVMAEERHRFSNLFPVITALVNMINPPENDVAKYKEMLIDRIRTLQATHLLLSSPASMSGLLHDLVAQELQPFKETRDITISGPSITVPSGAAESFAMLLHELTTNSVKYGALSDPRGRLEVNWQFASDGAGDDVVFDWAESGRRKNSSVGRHGFGSMIIGVDGTPIVGHSPKFQISEDGLRYSLRLSRKELEF